MGTLLKEGATAKALALPLILALTACGSASSTNAARAAQPDASGASAPITSTQAGVDDPPPKSPADAKIAGIALGMTLDQALAALKRFDPAYKVQPRYLANRPVEYGQKGTLPSEIPSGSESTNALPREYAVINDVFAEKSNSTYTCEKVHGSRVEGSMPFCADVQNAPVDNVTFWLSRDPANERVIAVERSVDYNTHPVPFVALTSDLAKKYPWYPSYLNHRNADALFEDWNWDRSGVQLHFDPSTHDSAHGNIPNNVKPGEGRGISVYIEWANGNPQLAGRFLVSLYDSDALYASVDQGLKTFNAAKEKWDTQQAGSHQGERTKM